MKKELLGCLVVLVLLVGTGAGLAYWYLLRPMFGSEDAVAEAGPDWARAVDAEAAIRNQSPFAPPADGRLTQQQVNAFVAAQSSVTLRLGTDFEELRRRYDQMRADQAVTGNPLSPADAAGGDKVLSDLQARAREALVDGLNQQDLSLAEYRWIRDQAYAALPLLDMDPDAIVAPKPPPGAAVDAATGEIIEFPDEPVLEPVPIEGDAPPPPQDDGLDYAGTAPDDPLLDGPTEKKPVGAVPPPDSIEALGTVKDRGLGDDRALDTPAEQAARANAVLLRPHKDLLLRTLGGWMGL